MEQQQQDQSFLTGSPVPSQDDKTMALIAHIGGIVAPILVPLIIMVTKGEKSSWVRAQSVEALNFQIGILIVYVVSAVLPIVGCITWVAAFLAAVVLGIMAGLKVNEGSAYRYPFALRLVK